MNGDSERFGEDGDVVCDSVRNRPDVIRRNHGIFCEYAVGIHPKSNLGRANIFMTGPAQGTIAAGKIRLHGDPLTDSQIGYAVTDFFDPSDRFMARNNRQWHTESSVIQRMVRSANAGQRHFNEDFS